MTNEEVIAQDNRAVINYLSLEGYQNLRELEDGTIVGTSELMFTRALYIGLNSLSWEKRFCFQDRERAIEEINKLTSGDDEPTGYIARRNA